jgi:hypothetical protein
MKAERSHIMNYDLFGNVVQVTDAEASVGESEAVQPDWFDIFDQMDLPY